MCRKDSRLPERKPEDVCSLEDVEPERGYLFEGTGAMIATGREVSEIIGSLERGPGAIASILESSLKLWRLRGRLRIFLQPDWHMQRQRFPNQRGGNQRLRTRPRGLLNFAVQRIESLAEEMGISYIGLSRNVCDLSNPHDMHQVMLWAIERKNLGDVINLWGSLPCMPWCSWQHLNQHILEKLSKKDWGREGRNLRSW